jgi:hypothetical protein
VGGEAGFGVLIKDSVFPVCVRQDPLFLFQMRWNGAEVVKRTINPIIMDRNGPDSPLRALRFFVVEQKGTKGRILFALGKRAPIAFQGHPTPLNVIPLRFLPFKVSLSARR